MQTCASCRTTSSERPASQRPNPTAYRKPSRLYVVLSLFDLADLLKELPVLLQYNRCYIVSTFNRFVRSRIHTVFSLPRSTVGSPQQSHDTIQTLDTDRFPILSLVVSTESPVLRAYSLCHNSGKVCMTFIPACNWDRC